MALDFEVPLDSCQAEAFARAYSEEDTTWHKALTSLSNTRVYGYNNGWVIDFEDRSFFVIENGGLTIACKDYEAFQTFFNNGLVQGRDLCRELYQQKLEVEDKLEKAFNNLLYKGDDHVRH